MEPFEPVILRNQVVPNIRDIDVYIADGGYEGLRAALQMQPAAVIETVEAQVEAARVLGFPVVRVQKLDADLYEWAAALAERAGVKLGVEVHAPLFVDFRHAAGQP